MRTTNAATLVVVACLTASADTSTVISRVLSLTGNRQVKMVWFEPQTNAGDEEGKGTDHALMGFDSHNGGVRQILPTIGTYSKPLLTADGRRVVFSNLTTAKCYIVNFDGTGSVQTLTSGHALDAWKDPSTGDDWIYVRRSTGIWRCKMADTTVSQLVWNKVATGNDGDGMYTQDYFQVSADGTHAVDQVNGWPNIGVMLLPNVSVTYLHRTGCWSSISPDNSYRALHRNADHWSVWIYNSPTDTGHLVDLSAVTADWNAGQVGPDYYVTMIKWSTDVRFVGMVSPEVNQTTWDRSCSEVYLGRFDSTLTRLDGWARITYNSKGDWQPDTWIADSATQPTQVDTPVINLTPTDLGFGLKPGDTAGLSQSIAVTNGGSGTLQAITDSVQYTAGVTGWLSTTVSGTGNAQAILNKVTIAPLDTGIYQATVTVSSSNAAHKQYTVTLTLRSPTQPVDTGMTLTYPNGGEKLTVGQTIHIRWSMSAQGQGVSLLVSPDDGDTWLTIASVAATDTANWGNYAWTIPASILSTSLVSTTCIVRVQEYTHPNIADNSDSTFTIGPATGIRDARNAQAQMGTRYWSVAGALCISRPSGRGVAEGTVFDQTGRCVRTFTAYPGVTKVALLREGCYVVSVHGATDASVVKVSVP